MLQVLVCSNCCKLLGRSLNGLPRPYQGLLSARNFGFAKLEDDEGKRSPRKYFYRSAVSRQHKKDKLDPQTWRLVYVFPTIEWYLRVSNVILFYLPILCLVDMFLLNGAIFYLRPDYYWRFLSAHGLQYGLPIYWGIVVAGITRIRQVMMFRIYQNLVDGKSYIGVYQNFLGFKHKMPFTTTDVQVLPTIYSQTQLPWYKAYKQLFWPNIVIKNKGMYVNKDFNFRTHQDVHQMISLKPKIYENPDKEGLIQSWTARTAVLKGIKKDRADAAKKRSEEMKKA